MFTLAYTVFLRKHFALMTMFDIARREMGVESAAHQSKDCRSRSAASSRPAGASTPPKDQDGIPLVHLSRQGDDLNRLGSCVIFWT